MIFVSLYAGIMSVELISLSTTVSYVLDTIVIVLVIISVILFLKIKESLNFIIKIILKFKKSLTQK